VLFPRGEPVTALGALFPADIFPGRSTVRSETWIYADPPARDDSELVLRDRQVLTGRADPPIAIEVTRWPRALPVYDAAVLDAASRIADLPRWLVVTGNYLGRLGVAGLLQNGADAAARVSGG
jgi:protoporphyrinogen oxidase